MLPNSLSRNISLLLTCTVLYLGCLKTNPGAVLNNPPPNTNPGGSNGQPPLITQVGIPIGDPITATIGPSGGTLVSDDGVTELIIPAGALASNTPISIQTVTNEVPGAIGFSYHLMPDGTKFS